MNDNCIRCKYSSYKGFNHKEGVFTPWYCELDDQPIEKLEGVCTMYEESAASKLIANHNPSGQSMADIEEIEDETSPDLIPDFPDDVQDWINTHPPKEQGIKYDDNKPRIAEMIQDFGPELLALCKVWEFGADKYGKSNWKFVNDGERRYTNALVRHLLAENDSVYDSESYLLHAAHIAFNSLARLHFILQNFEVKRHGNN